MNKFLFMFFCNVVNGLFAVVCDTCYTLNAIFFGYYN